MVFRHVAPCIVAALFAAAGAAVRGQSPSGDIPVARQIEQLTKEISDHPTDAALLVRRAELHHANGRWGEMKSDLDRALAIRPRDAWALALRGLAVAAGGDYARGLVDLDASLAIEPRSAFTLGLRGNVLMHMGRLDDAIDSFTRSIAEKPLARVHFDRGFCHELQDDLPRAIADYTDASRIDPDLMDAVCARGQAFQRTGDFRRAIADLDRCRTWRPDDPRAALSLAWLLATCPDAGLRDGRKALLLAGDLCDTVTCQTPETLTALAAAYAELGEFARAQTLQERAVAIGHFAPDFHQASARRLDAIRRREPIREARIPLGILPRPMQEVPRTITLEEALAAPADVLGSRYLQARTLALTCTIASAGATINAMLDEGPLTITAANAGRVARALDDRLAVFSKAIQRRGHARLAAGYRARVEGGCAAWGLDAAPVLVEQDGPDLHLTQGNVRHMGVVVETQVVFRHDTNTDIIITGRIDDGRILFVTAERPGLDGSADRRCTMTLTPAEIAGPDWAEAFAGRANAFQSYREYDRMLADLERSLAVQPQAAVAALRAWVLATCPDARVRDGRRAVAAAEEAGRLAAGTMDLMVQTCLAVAHAEAGDFAAAVRHQRKAVDLAPAGEKPGQRERLRLFESRRPFHEPRTF